jgi:hypothetical protein
MRAVIWSGPVDLSQVKGATLPDAPAKNINCRGKAANVPSPWCNDIGPSFLDSDGRTLPKLMASVGLPADTEAFLGSFSAGYNIVRPALLDARDRAQVKAVVLSDSTYMSVGGPPSEGYIRFALDAIGGDKMLIATASDIPGSTGLPTGWDTIEALVAEIEKRSGLKFEDGADLFAGVTPNPVKAYKLGGIAFGKWPSTGPGAISHPEHATKLAAQAWGTILMPWLTGTKPVPVTPVLPPASEPFDWRWLALVGGAAGGYAAIRLYQTRRRRR